MTAPRTRFMAVVKADGYGHGAVESARAALAGGAHRLGVATALEALALREAGISAPLQVLSEVPNEAVPALLAADVVFTVFRRESAAALSRAAVAAGKPATFHLKVDTGMNRIGVRAEDAADLVESLTGTPGIEMEGVFTHFATADVPGDWDFETQMERFRAFLAEMERRSLKTGIVHAANSPATILHPESHFDMVRCGIAIYGLHPAASTHGAIELVPAMTVKARVTNVHRIGMGEGVSYGAVYRAAGPTVIGTVPVGYADGLHRSLSEKLRFGVAGREMRQVGRICMDQTMFEVPGSAQVAVGDEVALAGAAAPQSLERLGELSGTIDYEMACAFGMRLERNYR